MKLALVFPDTYEVGMSHLGLKILYDLLNRNPEYLVERVFTPWTDMEKQLQGNNLQLFSLENRLPISEFDILGFSLQYELCYTNILTILDLGKIPFRSAARDLSHPLIIAGGPCTSNPEPIADFFDAFLIGEGEEALPELMEAYTAARNKYAPLGGRAAKEAVLRDIARVPGWYVPSLYEVATDPATGLQYINPPQTGECETDSPPFPIERRFVEDLSKYPFPSENIVPTTEVVHDRVAIEIARGCLEGCRFCQAGTIYRPLRERKPSEIVDSILKGLDSTGYDDASLTSLSTGDYRCIEPLVRTLMGMLEEKRVALSVSSLRAYSLSNDLTEQIKRVRRTGFTIAPEAGTQRMRDVISKGITEQDVIQATRNAFQAGWTQLKMYFMIGLPTETMEDVDGIVELGKKALAEARAAGNSRVPEISISVSTFIPKPFAPFQWCRMDDQQQVHAKQERLRVALRKARLRFKWHDPESSYLECVFSRGDRRLSQVIECAWQMGCRFDGWTEQLKMDLWRRAFEECQVDQQIYMVEIPLDAPLPWDHLNSLVKKEWLIQELRRALKSKASPACGKVFKKPLVQDLIGQATQTVSPPAAQKEHTGEVKKRPIVCYDCGLDCDLTVYERMESDGLKDLQSNFPEARFFRILDSEIEERPASAPNTALLPAPEVLERRRYLASYEKLGVLKFASHLDLIRLIPRTFNRAGVRLKYSQGFHPKPVFTFGPALGVGKESIAEWVEFESVEEGTEGEFLLRINAKCPEGLRFTRWQAVPADAPSLTELIDCAEYSAVLTIPSGNDGQFASLAFSIRSQEELSARIAELLQHHSIEVLRQKQERTRTVDIRPGILELTAQPAGSETHLRMILSTASTTSVRPEEALSALLAESWRPWYVRRESLGTYSPEGVVSPLDFLNTHRIGAEIGLHAERAYSQQQLT